MKQIPLTQGQLAIVDDADYDWLNQWKWRAVRDRKTWYAVRTSSENGRSNRFDVFMHRVILGIKDRLQLSDHRDRNGLNNQRLNLRIATCAENSRNRTHKRKTNSGFVGIIKRKHGYTATLKIFGKRKYVGYSTSAVQAARLRDKAVLELHGEFAVLNFPM